MHYTPVILIITVGINHGLATNGAFTTTEFGFHISCFSGNTWQSHRNISPPFARTLLAIFLSVPPFAEFHTDRKKNKNLSALRRNKSLKATDNLRNDRIYSTLPSQGQKIILFHGKFIRKGEVMALLN